MKREAAACARVGFASSLREKLLQEGETILRETVLARLHRSPEAHRAGEFDDLRRETLDRDAAGVTCCLASLHAASGLI